MGQTLTISTRTLDVDGKTLSLQLAGGTGSGWLPASGITGITVTSNTGGSAGLLHLASLTMNTSTGMITAVLTFPVGVGKTALVNFATTSNVTDDGGNTAATGQSALSVTNNSTIPVTAYASSNALLKSIGYFVQFTSSNRNRSTCPGSFHWAVGATGTDMAIVGIPTTAISTINIIDGAAAANSNYTGFVANTYTAMPVFSGLSDALHSVDSQVITGIFLDMGTGATTNGSILVAGASPAISAPSGNWGTAYSLDSAPFTTYGVRDAWPIGDGFTFGGHNIKSLVNGQSLRFASDSSFITIYGKAVGQKFELYCDGASVGTVTIPSAATFYTRQELFTGLNTASVHEYELIAYSPTVFSTGPATYIIGYLELGGVGIASVAHTARPIISWYGDSIIAGTLMPTTDSRDISHWQVCRAIGKTSGNLGNSGQNVSVYLKNNTSQIYATSVAVVCNGGINDLTASVNVATFQSDYGIMIDNIRARVGAGVPIYCRQILPCPAATTAGTRATYNAAIPASISGKADVYTYSTDNWLSSGASSDCGDTKHPSASGNIKVSNREIPILSATAFGVSGPSSCVIGVPSSAFTLTMSNGATNTGDQPITLTGVNCTISVTAASVSLNDTASPTATPANGATGFTFTVTSISGGPVSVSFSTTQDLWTMPADVSIVAVSASLGSTRSALSARSARAA